MSYFVQDNAELRQQLQSSEREKQTVSEQLEELTKTMLYTGEC